MDNSVKQLPNNFNQLLSLNSQEFHLFFISLFLKWQPLMKNKKLLVTYQETITHVTLTLNEQLQLFVRLDGQKNIRSRRTTFVSHNENYQREWITVEAIRYCSSIALKALPPDNTFLIFILEIITSHSSERLVLGDFSCSKVNCVGNNALLSIIGSLFFQLSTIFSPTFSNSAKLAPKKFFAHVNRNKRMGTRIQRLLHPDGSPETTNQEMADLLKQTFQSFYRTGKGSTPTFHPRTEISMATPTSRNQKPKELSNPSTPIRELVLMGSFPKPFKPWVST